MDIDNIVDKIVEEVLRRATELEKSLKVDEDKEKLQYWEVNKKDLLITERPDSKRFKDICNMINYEFYKVYSIKDYFEGKKEFDEIIIGSLNNRELANLSMGIQCGAIENIIIPSLFKGIKVFLLNDEIEYRKYECCCINSLFNLYKNHEKNVESYGVEILSLSELKNKFNKTHGISYPNKECEASSNTNILIEDDREDLTDKKVITESELKRLLGRNKKGIIVNSKVIITPLCRDFLKKYKIHVEVK